MLLCQLNPVHFECIFGDLGLCGKLGYDDLLVSVKLRHHTTSIAFHPPGKVVYELDGEYEHFTALIGFNDTSLYGIKADFLVYADDVLVAAACGVCVNDQPREIFANINQATKLELVVETNTPQGCHPVWIAPTLHKEKMSLYPGVLGRAWGRIPDVIPVCEKCIFTTLTPNFVGMLDDMLGSLYINGDCQDASIFIFALNADDKCRRLASKYNATIIPISVENTHTLVLKSLVYSVASFINADYYLMLDADMFILQSLDSIFNTIKAANESNILVCREYNIPQDHTLRHLLTTDGHPYFGEPGNDAFLQIKEEGETTFIVNGGLIGGSRKAWLSLDSAMRTYMPHSSAWDMQKPGVTWREQAIFNLALGKTQHYTELNPNFNVQMLFAKPNIQVHEKFLLAFMNRQIVHVLHFNGVPGKEAYKPFAGKFSHIPNAKFGFDNVDSFASFAQKLQLHGKAIKNKPHLRAIYSDIEDLHNQIHVYKHMFDLVSKMKEPEIFEIGCRAGLMTSCLATACANNNGKLQTIEFNTSPEYYQIIETLPEQIQKIIIHIDEDALVYLKKTSEKHEKFDMILCGTHNNIRNICSQIVLSKKMLNPGGVLYVMDSKYPLCDIDGLNRRLTAAKLKLMPVSGEKLSGLYTVENHNEDTL